MQGNSGPNRNTPRTSSSCCWRSSSSRRRFPAGHLESIRMITADAWEELRVRPTADLPRGNAAAGHRGGSLRGAPGYLWKISPAGRRRCCPIPSSAGWTSPRRARTAPEKIVIGLYSLPDEHGEHRWCTTGARRCASLYYDAMPGRAPLSIAPPAKSRGELTLKRQYRMENGRLQAIMSIPQLSIDDRHAAGHALPARPRRHMRQIVSTIQAEQNAAIRCEGAPGGLRRRAARARARPAWPCTARPILMYRQPRHCSTRAASRFSRPARAFSEVHLHGAARAGRGEHPLAHAARDRRGDPRPAGSKRRVAPG